MVRDYKGRMLRMGARGTHPLSPDNLRVYDITSRLKKNLLYWLLCILSSSYYVIYLVISLLLRCSLIKIVYINHQLNQPLENVLYPPLNTVTESFIERMLTQGKSSFHSPPPYLFLVVVVVYVVDKGGPTHT